jgi:hypothetical protein
MLLAHMFQPAPAGMYDSPLCPCGALLDPGHPTLCRKCRNRLRWFRKRNGRRGTGHDRPHN